MKRVASVLSWIGGIITAVYLWIVFGYIASFTDFAFLIIPALYTILDLVILIWREKAVENGNKVGCGVCTLIFCSLVGGILTLCIPDSQLYGHYRRPSNSSSYTSHYHSTPTPSSTPKLSPLDRAAKITEYEQELRAGKITREEYNRKVALLDGKIDTQPSKPIQKVLSENEKIDLISKYKKLLDEGAITEEEFAQKKKELL